MKSIKLICKKRSISLIFLVILMGLIFVEAFRAYDGYPKHDNPNFYYEADFDIIRCDPTKMAPGLLFFHALEGERWYWVDECKLKHVFIAPGHTNIARPHKDGMVAIINQKPYDYDKSGHNRLNSKRIFKNLPVALHHDFFVTNRGTYMGIGREFYYPISKSWRKWSKQLLKEAKTAGLSWPDDVISDDVIVEFDGDGKVIWSWSTNEHLLGGKEKAVNLSVYKENWVHSNSIREFPDKDILFSARNINEVVRIEYPSGNIVWRIGSDILSLQHHATILNDGNILIYDNGQKLKKTGVVVLSPSGKVIMNQRLPFYAHAFGSVERLPNGNYLLIDGDGEDGRHGGTIYEFLPDFSDWVFELRLNRKNIVPWTRSGDKQRSWIYRAHKLDDNSIIDRMN